MRVLEPSDCFLELCDPRIDSPSFDFRITVSCPRHRGITRIGCDCDRFDTTLLAAIEIALQDIGDPHAPPAYCFEARIIDRIAVLERAAGISAARLPPFQGICCGAQMAQGEGRR